MKSVCTKRGAVGHRLLIQTSLHTTWAAHNERSSTQTKDNMNELQLNWYLSLRSHETSNLPYIISFSQKYRNDNIEMQSYLILNKYYTWSVKQLLINVSICKYELITYLILSNQCRLFIWAVHYTEVNHKMYNTQVAFVFLHTIFCQLTKVLHINIYIVSGKRVNIYLYFF